jgi:hypothetical protein
MGSMRMARQVGSKQAAVDTTPSTSRMVKYVCGSNQETPKSNERHQSDACNERDAASATAR